MKQVIYNNEILDLEQVFRIDKTDDGANFYVNFYAKAQPAIATVTSVATSQDDETTPPIRTENRTDTYTYTTVEARIHRWTINTGDPATDETTRDGLFNSLYQNALKTIINLDE